MAHDVNFVDALPSDQHILDLYEGEWSSAMPAGSGVTTQPGHAGLFSDGRITWAAQELGPFEGLDILELGPLEGAHSYMLQKAGAKSVTAIEANKRAFIKCLCVKEVFDLTRVRFKLGSFMHYLPQCDRFDVIIASGVLYHMTEPLRLLDMVLQKTDRFFLWTHYYDSAVIGQREDRELFAPPEALDGSTYRGVKKLYAERALSWQGFSGGKDSYAIWIERQSLLQFFKDRGFTITLDFDDPNHVNGPALALCAKR